ncbi:MAG: type II toxin-antitoxin system RelE/ParE family toxin [Streptosporangiaceae bacterium]|nr:type II toxin-antitoxin system RelE/ParE family toxin [Streptosporangiaceae bacterium]
MNEPYGLIVWAQARRALERTLPSQVAFAAWEFIAGTLRDNPHRVGKPLVAPFQGDWSARRGHYRIRYRIDDEKHLVTVIDIADRSGIYFPGR